MNENDCCSFWLIPERTRYHEFAELSELLSVNRDVSRLDPHVTLFVGRMKNLESPAGLIQDVFSESRFLTLITSGISWAEKFSKSFYIEFEPSQELTRLHQLLCEKLTNPLDYRLHPHLSLFYQQGNMLQKARLAETLTDYGRKISFDRLRVTSHPEIIRTENDIGAFEMITEFSLPGSGLTLSC